LKPPGFQVQFGAGVGQRTDVLFLHAVVGFGLFLISPPSLSAWQPNHQPLFQLFTGHFLPRKFYDFWFTEP
jgi:hypothetical protein